MHNISSIQDIVCLNLHSGVFANCEVNICVSYQAAAQDLRKPFESQGGKLDDITVVVAYVAAPSASLPATC